jgi:hypothetical protein
MKRILTSAVVGIVIGLVLGAMLGHKLPPTQEQVVDFIGHQSLSDLATFNKALMTKWGLQVFQPPLGRAAALEAPPPK